MRRRLSHASSAGALLLVASLVGPAHAETADAVADPLRSSACLDALAALTHREAAGAAASPAASTGRSPDPALQAARTRAAHACLASRADPPVPQRLAQPPLAVPPVTTARSVLPAAAPAVPPAAPAAPAPRPAEPPRFTLTCDALGCWANDGTRLNRVGPDLWGSRGACSVQGTLLQCP